jgi:O-methyltransferase
MAIKESGACKKIYALDSFEGFDEVADREAAYLGAGIENNLLRKGAFSETSLELIQWKIRATNLESIVIPVKGYFCETLRTLPTDQFCFVHLDCDLADSYKDCLAYFYPRMASGGYICFDEYRIPDWPLTTQAIDDFFLDKPEKPVLSDRTIKGGKVITRWHVRKMLAR